MMVTAGAETLAEQHCEAFAVVAAKQVGSLAVAQMVNTAQGMAMQALATQFGVDPATLQIAADSVQLFCLIKAARANGK